MATGLASKVRRSVESDEFELANYDQARCDDLVKCAFSEPFPIGTMIRLSFVVGGGKLVRQKFSDDLPKIFMNSLSAIGFVDDLSASLEPNSAGKYKYQHDTGKNLKFVHVFPRIAGPQAAAQPEGGAEEEGEEKPQTPEETLMSCGPKEFERLVKEHLLTYSQQKRLLDLLKTRIATLATIEGKMTRLEKLTAEEQALFDGVGADVLGEKAKVISGEMQKLIDEGKLTGQEKTVVIEQMENKLELLDAEIEKATAENKPKKVEALQKQREVLQKTKSSAKDASGCQLPPLRHTAELRKLYSKLLDLAKLEKGNKGNYTIEELRKLGERPEIEEAVAILEARSRLWLEDESIFKDRVDACKRESKASSAKAKPSAPSSIGGYTAVGSSGARPAKAKASAPSTRNGFGALG